MTVAADEKKIALRDLAMCVNEIRTLSRGFFLVGNNDVAGRLHSLANAMEDDLDVIGGNRDARKERRTKLEELLKC